MPPKLFILGVICIAAGLVILGAYDPTLRTLFFGSSSFAGGAAGGGGATFAAGGGFTAAQATAAASSASTLFMEAFAGFTLCVIGLILLVANSFVRAR